MKLFRSRIAAFLSIPLFVVISLQNCSHLDTSSIDTMIGSSKSPSLDSNGVTYGGRFKSLRQYFWPETKPDKKCDKRASDCP